MRMRTFVHEYSRALISYHRHIVALLLAFLAATVIMPFIVFARLVSKLPASMLHLVYMMETLSQLYNPVQIASFSMAMVIALHLEELNKGILEYLVISTSLPIERLLIARTLCSTLVLAPIIVVAIVVQHAAIATLVSSIPLHHVAISLLLSISTTIIFTLGLTHLVSVSILLLSSRYRIVMNYAIPLAIVLIQQFIAYNVLVGKLYIESYGYSIAVMIALLAVLELIIAYSVSKKLSSKIIINILSW